MGVLESIGEIMRTYRPRIITLTPEQFEALIHKIKEQLKK